MFRAFPIEVPQVLCAEIEVRALINDRDGSVVVAVKALAEKGLALSSAISLFDWVQWQLQRWSSTKKSKKNKKKKEASTNLGGPEPEPVEIKFVESGGEDAEAAHPWRADALATLGWHRDWPLTSAHKSLLAVGTGSNTRKRTRASRLAFVLSWLAVAADDLFVPGDHDVSLVKSLTAIRERIWPLIPPAPVPRPLPADLPGSEEDFLDGSDLLSTPAFGETFEAPKQRNLREREERKDWLQQLGEHASRIQCWPQRPWKEAKLAGASAAGAPSRSPHKVDFKAFFAEECRQEALLQQQQRQKQGQEQDPREIDWSAFFAEERRQEALLQQQQQQKQEWQKPASPSAAAAQAAEQRGWWGWEGAGDAEAGWAQDDEEAEHWPNQSDRNDAWAWGEADWQQSDWTPGWTLEEENAGLFSAEQPPSQEAGPEEQQQEDSEASAGGSDGCGDDLEAMYDALEGFGGAGAGPTPTVTQENGGHQVRPAVGPEQGPTQDVLVHEYDMAAADQERERQEERGGDAGFPAPLQSDPWAIFLLPPHQRGAAGAAGAANGAARQEQQQDEDSWASWSRESRQVRSPDNYTRLSEARAKEGGFGSGHLLRRAPRPARRQRRPQRSSPELQRSSCNDAPAAKTRPSSCCRIPGVTAACSPRTRGPGSTLPGS